MPAATMMVSPDEALSTAFWIVLHALPMPDAVQLLPSFPTRPSTYQVVLAAACPPMTTKPRRVWRQARAADRTNARRTRFRVDPVAAARSVLGEFVLTLVLLDLRPLPKSGQIARGAILVLARRYLRRARG